MNKIWFSGIAVASIMALVACGNGSTSSNTGGSGGTTSNGGGGATGGGGSANGGGGSGGGTSCHDCACGTGSACAAVCDATGTDANGNPVLNFCTKGDTTGSMCASCVATNCGGTALADCM
jgi:hypothetical protein